MTLTKKHFKAIAEILREHIKADLENAGTSNSEQMKDNSEKLINDFCHFCRVENGLFSCEKFREAIFKPEGEK